MEFRKEKSEKSKEWIRNQFKSDIFNIDTGYYKTENILPVTSKPNQRQKKVDFIPKYKEIKHYERHFNDLLSDQQKRSSNIKKFKPNPSRKNYDLEMRRNRSKEILDNCYDNRGVFSAKKLYLLEFYGKEKLNTICNDDRKRNYQSNKSIKEKRNTSNNKYLNNKRILSQNLPQELDIDSIDNESRIQNLKNNFIDDYNDTYQVNNTTNNINVMQYNLYPNIKKQKETNFESPKNKFHRKTFSITNINTDNINNIKPTDKLEKKYYGHRDITKLFSTENINPIVKKLKKIDKVANKNDEKDYYDIEIKNMDSEQNIDDKKIKEIFYKNGLHMYDINNDGLNGLFREKKIEAKIRKDRNDEGFDKKYRKVVKELDKYKIEMDECKINDEKGFLNKNGRKKRRGTPGNALHNRKLDKHNDNNKLNTGFYNNKK